MFGVVGCHDADAGRVVTQNPAKVRRVELHDGNRFGCNLDRGNLDPRNLDGPSLSVISEPLRHAHDRAADGVFPHHRNPANLW